MKAFYRVATVLTLLLLGYSPVSVITPNKAEAMCAILGDGYYPHINFDFDVYQLSLECDTYEECDSMADALVKPWIGQEPWVLTCSDLSFPTEDISLIDSDNSGQSSNTSPTTTLGAPPSLIPDKPVQVWQVPASCYGSSCTGLDPSKTRCEVDAYTIYSRNVVITSSWSSAKGTGPYGVAEMRYSPSCHANWVRFTPYGGVDSFLRTLFNLGMMSYGDGGLGTIYSRPYIWRQADGKLQGPINSSDPFAWQQTTWTGMVSAEGATCWSVEIHWAGDHHAGAGERDHIGTYDPECVT